MDGSAQGHDDSFPSHASQNLSCNDFLQDCFMTALASLLLLLLLLPLFFVDPLLSLVELNNSWCSFY